MKIETQPIENHQVKIIAELDNDNLEQFKVRAARKIAQEAKIPGFRPGKAPYDVVRRLYGDDMVEKQAIELLIDDSYPKILDEANIKPGGAGNLEEIISSSPPKFSFVIPLMPEVTLCDYQSMRQDYKFEALTQDEYDNFINNIRKGTATAEEVDRAAEKDDLVSIMLNGKVAEPVEGEDSTLVRDRAFQVIIGDDIDSEDAWPFPGFSEELISLKKDDEKTVIYFYPEDSKYEKLRGKEVEFKVQVQLVKKLNLPVMDDEFAKTIGYDTLAEMEKSIHDRLEENKKSDYDQDYAEGLLEDIVEKSEIKYPPAVLEDEMHHVLHSLEHDLSDKRMDLDTYLKLRNIEKDDFMESEIKPAAIKRLDRSLVLEKISETEKIKLDEELLQSEVSLALSQLATDPSFKKPKNKSEYKQLVDAVSFDTANRLFNKQIIDRIVEIGSGKVSSPVKEEKEDKETETVEEKPAKAKKPRAKKSTAE